MDYITHNYPESIETLDKIEKEALEMADYMTQGIVRHFPGCFVA